MCQHFIVKEILSLVSPLTEMSVIYKSDVGFISVLYNSINIHTSSSAALPSP